MSEQDFRPDIGWRMSERGSGIAAIHRIDVMRERPIRPVAREFAATSARNAVPAEPPRAAAATTAQFL